MNTTSSHDAPADDQADDLVLVVCLCARWCGSCRDYRAVFDRIGAAFGAGTRWVWIDIEDDAALLDGIDVEDFPTLMLARADAPLFFGSETPHAETLRRLVDTALSGGLPAMGEAPASAPAVAELPGRLRAAADSTEGSRAA